MANMSGHTNAIRQTGLWQNAGVERNYENDDYYRRTHWRSNNLSYASKTTHECQNNCSNEGLLRGFRSRIVIDLIRRFGRTYCLHPCGDWIWFGWEFKWLWGRKYVGYTESTWQGNRVPLVWSVATYPPTATHSRLTCFFSVTSASIKTNSVSWIWMSVHTSASCRHFVTTRRNNSKDYNNNNNNNSNNSHKWRFDIQQTRTLCRSLRQCTVHKICTYVRRLSPLPENSAASPVTVTNKLCNLLWLNVHSHAEKSVGSFFLSPEPEVT
jgi:hypothetical protein